MNIVVRNEEAKDFRRAEEVAREAFWNLYFPGGHEHYLVHIMRDHKDTIKELSFVIEVDGKVEGAIYYTHSKIVQEGEEDYSTITFGPVFISPELHRKGLGRKLIAHSLEKAKEMGFNGVVILGFPHHYAPYGFVGGKKYNIGMGDGNYYVGLQALPLKEKAFENIKGYAQFSDVYEFTQEQVDEFDKAFPAKEKLSLQLHEAYAAACVEQDIKVY